MPSRSANFLSIPVTPTAVGMGPCVDSNLLKFKASEIVSTIFAYIVKRKRIVIDETLWRSAWRQFDFHFLPLFSEHSERIEQTERKAFAAF